MSNENIEAKAVAAMPTGLKPLLHEYEKAGFKVIPFKTDKENCHVTSWSDLLTETSNQRIQKIFDLKKAGNDVLIGLVIGSDWTIVDVDNPAEFQKLFPNLDVSKYPQVQSPSGGLHIYCRAVPEIPKKIGAKTLKWGDVLVGKNLIYAPGGDDVAYEKHGKTITGNYTWTVRKRLDTTTDIPPVPQEIIDHVLSIKPATKSPVAAISAPVNELQEQWQNPVLRKHAQDIYRMWIGWLLEAKTGARNATLNDASHALGTYIAVGALDQTEVVAALMKAAKTIGLDEKETRKTIASGLTAGLGKPAPVPEKMPYLPHKTDRGNAEWYVYANWDNVHYNKEFHWISWDGKRWKINDDQLPVKYAKTTIDTMFEYARTLDGDDKNNFRKHVFGLENINKIRSMLEMAKDEMGVSINVYDADDSRYLLNAQNGTIDLQTGELLPHSPHHHITNILDIDYDPTATCPTWEAYLKEVMRGNMDMVNYLQRAVGYSLTGDISEQCLFFLNGGGSNGKSTFVELLMYLFGEYSRKTQVEMVMYKKFGNDIPNDIALLKNARVCVTTEVQRGQKLNESRIKDITGGDKLSARFMRAEWFEFNPTFKLWMYGNYKPEITGTDDGIWRRIRLIPFTRKFEDHEKDTHLIDKLKAEVKGILAWAVRGCLEWFKQGLNEPKTVKTATEDYRAESNIIAHFVEDECKVDKASNAPQGETYNRYKEWARRNNEDNILSRKEFSTLMESMGFYKVHKESGNVFEGIELTPYMPNRD